MRFTRYSYPGGGKGFSDAGVRGRGRGTRFRGGGSGVHDYHRTDRRLTGDKVRKRAVEETFKREYQPQHNHPPPPYSNVPPRQHTHRVADNHKQQAPPPYGVSTAGAREYETNGRRSAAAYTPEFDRTPPPYHRGQGGRLSPERTGRGRTRAKNRDKHDSRDRSLSSVLSDISSGSSCFGTVRASEAYGSPVYEDVTEETDDSLARQGMKVATMLKHKKRKKEKRKKEKAKEKERKRLKKDKRRQKEILEERICPPEHEVAQSKEIFASGQNILVSVSFAEHEKEKEKDKYKKVKKKKAKAKKEKVRVKVSKESPEVEPEAEEEAKEPSEGEDDEEQEQVHQQLQQQQQQLQQQLQQQQLQQQQLSMQQSQSQQVEKKKKKLDPGVKPVMIIDLERSPGRQVISSPKEVIELSDEENKRLLRLEEEKGSEGDLNNRGPNTPPEPAPRSPESYDPFEPTKSSSISQVSAHQPFSISTTSFTDFHRTELPDGKADYPPHLYHYPGHVAADQLIAEQYDDGILDLHPSSPFEKMDMISPRPMLTFHQSPLKAIQRSTPRKLLAQSRTHSNLANSSGASGGPIGAPFEDELNDGDISPYSPRSSDCDEHMFDPPPEDDGETKTIALTVDNLRKVFGNDPKTLYGDLRKSYQHKSVIAVDEMYKPHKMTMEMLDEIPDSAVDLQVKEKLIKKLQRQERIVEEVKHFLKPHFNKKRIEKDEYKEIMRKSIPKICHSRSGEINPAKIQALITAYVKKAMAKRKLQASGGTAIVSSTTAVT